MTPRGGAAARRRILPGPTKAQESDPCRILPRLTCSSLWERARAWQDRIVVDIDKHFRIVDVIELRWTVERAFRHLSRLYGQWLPPDSQKLIDCGSGAPLIVVVSDDAPRYGRRRKWGTTYTVNTHLFDAKQRYRALTRASSVHSTTSVAETEHDLFLLLGLRSADYANRALLRWDGVVRPVARNPTGDGGWASMNEMLTAVELTLPYVRLPDMVVGAEMRLLSTGLCERCDLEWLLSEPDRHPTPVDSWSYPVVIAGREVVVELHDVGDGHHPRQFQQAMLERRIRDVDGAFVLAPEDALLELAFETASRGEWSQTSLHRIQALASARELPPLYLADLDEAKRWLEVAMHERGYDDQEVTTVTDGSDRSIVARLTEPFEILWLRILGLRQRLYRL